MDGLNRLTIRAVFVPSGQVGNFLINVEDHNRIPPTTKIVYGDRLTSLLNSYIAEE